MSSAPLYLAEPANKELRSIVNPRRGAVRTVPGLGWRSYWALKQELFEKFALSDYSECVTGEMYSRPVPHVFNVKETEKLTSLYEAYAPTVIARILGLIRAPVQTLNKTSRLGWPWFDRPELKKARLAPAFSQLERKGAAEALSGSFIIMNVRLQPEPVTKERDFTFVSKDGKAYSKKVGKQERTIEVGDLGKMVAARTRLVFNMPFANLYKQVLDTAMHDVELSYPLFHHNLYSPTGHRPLLGTVRALDVKHFERHTASLARMRAQIIGGLYADIVHEFTNAPFLCPSDDWKSLFFLKPNRAAGLSDQFASGDSAVAPVQKEVFACLYWRFAETVLGVHPDHALDWALQGGDERLTILNYGDDNILSGDPKVLDECFAFLAEYLHVEEEDPAKFLGFLWTPEGFRLGPSSYLLKTWLNERAPGTTFRKYPFFGWVEKRKVYTDYGVPDIAGKIFPLENNLLDSAGMSWTHVLQAAQEEAMALSQRLGAYKHPAWLLDKDYLMTAEEKIATGLFEGLYPAETAPMINKLLGPSWRKTLR